MQVLTPNTITEDAAVTAKFWGFSVHETAGATVAVEFRDEDASGQILWTLDLAANQSASIVFPRAVYAASGDIHVKVTGDGTLAGVIFDTDNV